MKINVSDCRDASPHCLVQTAAQIKTRLHQLCGMCECNILLTHSDRDTWLVTYSEKQKGEQYIQMGYIAIDSYECWQG